MAQVRIGPPMQLVYLGVSCGQGLFSTRFCEQFRSRDKA
jgi:hypothetical protein